MAFPVMRNHLNFYAVIRLAPNYMWKKTENGGRFRLWQRCLVHRARICRALCGAMKRRLVRFGREQTAFRHARQNCSDLSSPWGRGYKSVPAWCIGFSMWDTRKTDCTITPLVPCGGAEPAPENLWRFGTVPAVCVTRGGDRETLWDDVVAGRVG